MDNFRAASFTSFDGHRRIASGSLQANALVVKQALASGAQGPVLTFDDRTGRFVEIDVRGTEGDVLERLAARGFDLAEMASSDDALTDAGEPRGRGRPRLGVVGREVTLLPRHWAWLEGQPGGASVTLRRLVEDARRANVERDRQRASHERAYHFMSAIGGDLPGFEEASRALFANDEAAFKRHTRAWPTDVRVHAGLLAFDRS